ncbi:hypothetical protein [Deinococcus sp.]|nr:hypothetical protein [Deinococcus sp.]
MNVQTQRPVSGAVIGDGLILTAAPTRGPVSGAGQHLSAGLRYPGA